MICCEECFKDKEIKRLIKGMKQRGDCLRCHVKDVYIYNTEHDEQLATWLSDFISIFTPISMIPSNLNIENVTAKSTTLKAELFNNWNLFNFENEEQVYHFLLHVCKDKYDELPELFDEQIILVELFIDEEIKKHSILKFAQWETFTKKLIEVNRFHTHPFDEELFKKMFTFMQKRYYKGEIFYRCRISENERGIPQDKMSAPPSHLAQTGRASAKGIRCLYLSDTEMTTINETRPRSSDYVTIGTFKLLSDINVIDLKIINDLSPFTDELDAKEYAMNRYLFRKINDELAKPMKSNDSDLDYIPTQYVVDFIKGIERDHKPEYGGVEYSSVMCEDGNNLAIFDPELFECTKIATYQIGNLNYNKRAVR